MAELTLSAVHKRFGQHEVIGSIDLEVKDGEFVVFVGPSGCGKSTLLRIIAGLESLTSGSIRIGGEDVADRAPAERGIAMVFQTYALYPHKTVAGNMGYGLKLAGRSKSEVEAEVLKVAKTLELNGLLDRKPSALSGGQRQRVAIGRAIVRNPKVFLFDEPLSNLDAALRGQMRIEIADLHARLGATMIYVTHDQTEAMTMADRIVVLNAGRIEQQGTPLELYHHPENQFVAGFLGAPKMNFLPARVLATGASGTEIEAAGLGRLTIPVEGSVVAGSDVVLGIRPHDLDLDSGKQQVKVDIHLTEPLGHETVAYGRIEGDQRLTAVLDGSVGIAAGSQATLHFDPADCHLFDDTGKAFRRHAKKA